MFIDHAAQDSSRSCQEITHFGNGNGIDHLAIDPGLHDETCSAQYCKLVRKIAGLNINFSEKLMHGVLAFTEKF